MSLIVLVTLIISGYFAYEYFTGILKTQALNDDKIKLNQTARQMAYISDDTKKFAYNIIMDSDIQDFLKITSFSNYFEEIKSANYALQKLSYYIQLRDYIDSIVIIAPDNKTYWSSYPYEDYFNQKIKERWYTDFIEKNLSNGFTEKHQISFGGKVTDIVSYIIQLRSVEDPEKVRGKLVVNLKMDNLIKTLNLSNVDNEGVLWLGQNNEILYSKIEQKDKENIERLAGIATESGTDKEEINEDNSGYLIMDNSAGFGWKFLSYTSKERLYKKVNYVFYFLLIFIFAGMVFTILIVIPLIFNFTKPITNLNKAMKSVAEGNLDTEVNIKSGDELEDLGIGFNHMVKDIKKYIDESLKNEKAKKEIEYELLISQINPHFIYNTLNTVIYYARKQGNDDIVNLMSSFINILQDAVRVNENGVMATLGSEIDIVEHYVKIQKYKYINRFDLIWDVDESLKGKSVPRTLIQPLVENALIHGILLKEGMGIIKVTVKQSEGKLEILVYDNGIGIKKETLDRLTKASSINRPEAKMRSIGIPNLMERIRFIYGESYGVHIESSEGEWTEIKVILPLE